jgi:hypothetical protein
MGQENPPAPFDEQGEETERCRMAKLIAPLLDSLPFSPWPHLALPRHPLPAAEAASPPLTLCPQPLERFLRNRGVRFQRDGLLIGGDGLVLALGTL